jgi:HEAT repeat protein
MSVDPRQRGILLTVAELRIVAWDSWLARVTGLSSDAVRGRTLLEVVPDLESRGLLDVLRSVLTTGAVELFAPAVHQALIPCPPQQASPYFDRMQQRVTIGALRHEERIAGLMITIEDVTARREHERALAADLRHPDLDVRTRAAADLAQANAIVSSGALRALWSEGTWQTRRATVWRLVGRGDRDLVGSLLMALRDGHRDFGVLSSALSLLALSEVDIVGPLVDFLRDSDSNLRLQVALALGDRPDPRATSALLAALHDSDSNVRFHAIEALGRLRAADAVDPLIAIAESRDFFLAFPAIDALGKIGERRIAGRLIPLLDVTMLRGAVADALGVLGDATAVPALVALLDQPDAPVDAIVRSLRALRDRAEDNGGVSAIADGVRTAMTATGSQRLLDAIGESGVDPEALAIVVSWLRGPAVSRALTRLLGSSQARPAAIEALIATGSHVVELLIHELDADDLEVREAAAIALGRIGDPRATPPLLAKLTDEELVVRIVEALGRLRDERAFEPLLQLLRHDDLSVRRAAVAALRALADPRTAERVVRLVSDADPRVREAAVKLATEMNERAAARILTAASGDAAETVRCAALELLGAIDPERASSILLGALADDTPRARAAAARALGQLRGADVAGALIRALGDPDPWVRYFAVRSLARHADASAVEALTRVARGDAAQPVVLASIETLKQLGRPVVAEGAA